MRTSIALAILAVPSLAIADEVAPPPPPPPPSPPAAVAPVPPPPVAVENQGPPTTGWQLQARMPTGLGLDTLISPGFTFGHRSGNLVIGAQIGITGGKFQTDDGAGNTDSTSVLLFSIMPVVYADVWESEDGRARMNIVGGIGYGRGDVTNENSDGMGGTNKSTDTIQYLPTVVGIGGDYYLGKHFALGCEFGAEIPILLSVTNNGADQHVSGNLESVRGLLRFTFVTGS